MRFEQVCYKDIVPGDKVLYFGSHYEVVDCQEKFMTVKPLHAKGVGGEIWHDYFDKVFKMVNE